MSDIKPWQIILVVVAIGVLAFSVWRTMGSSGVDIPSGHMTVDIQTGQLYLIKLGNAKGVVYPARNPDTDERTLYPVNKDEKTGDWVLHARSATSLTEEQRKNSSVLGNGLTVKPLDSDPIVFVLK